MRLLAFTTSLAIAVVAIHYQVPEPPAIKVHALTPEDITNGLHQEAYHKKLALAERVARRIYAAHGCHDEDLAFITAKSAIDHGVPASVLASLIWVESSCRPGAVARVDGKITACGLTQVNPHIWNISCEDLLDPDTAIDAGATIFASYHHRYGLRDGLHHYLGMGADDGEIDGDSYATKVLTVAGYRHPELIN